MLDPCVEIICGRLYSGILGQNMPLTLPPEGRLVCIGVSVSLVSATTDRPELYAG